MEAEEIKPNIFEFSAIVAAGLIHILLEIVWNSTVSGWFSVIAVIFFLFYIVYKIYKHKGIFYDWGFRLDNLKQSLRVYVFVIVIGLTFLFVIGYLKGSLSFSMGMIYSSFIYIFWGIVQQFVIQNFLAINIEKYFKSPLVQAFLVSLLFAISHYPRLLLGGYAFLAGFLLVIAYRKHRNIYLAGISHGILATFLFYWAFEFNLSDWFSEIFFGLLIK